MKFQIATAAAALLFVVSAWAVEPAIDAPVSAAVRCGSATVRLVLVGVGTVLVGKSGATAYVVAFFVPYFAFTAFEGAFLHSLRRSGTPA